MTEAERDKWRGESCFKRVPAKCGITTLMETCASLCVA